MRRAELYSWHRHSCDYYVGKPIAISEEMIDRPSETPGATGSDDTKGGLSVEPGAPSLPDRTLIR